MTARLITIVIVIGLLLPGAAAIGQADTITGVIDNDAPFIRVPIQVTEDGSTIVADIQKTSGDLDTLLYLVDSSGNIVAENDDREKQDTNSLLSFPQADSGEYTLIATRYKVAEGDSSGDFELAIQLQQDIARDTYQVSDADLDAAGFPAIEPRDEAEWTVLAYYGGDNNLEPGILNDFDEFEVAGGSGERVRIIALLDRVPGFTDTSGDWDSARLFEIGPDVSGDHDTTFPPTVDSEPLADLGELDTGDGQTLAQFLVWAIRHYPARHYVIAFGSHGAGWQGLITDDTSDADILSVPELQQALDLARAEAGVETFDLLINDACLMSSIEYFGGLAPYFQFSLASPEIVVDPALDMTRLVRLISSSGSVSLRTIGKELVDTYILRDILKRDSSDIAYLTHAVTDLRRFNDVVQAVEHFARYINRSPAVYSALLGNVRSNTYTYTNFLGGNTKIDLGNFMRRIIATSTDSRLIQAAEDVLVALDTVRVYGNAGERVLTRTHYYNIYFPDTSADFKQSYFEESPLSQWGKMLRNYYNAVTPQFWTGGGLELGFHLPIAPKTQITNVYPTTETSIMNPVNLSVEIVGRRISYGDFTVDQIQPDGTARRLSAERILKDVVIDGELDRINEWQSGAQLIEFFWDVTLPTITDGAVSGNEMLIFTEEVAFLDGRYREPGSEDWHDVSVVFDINDDYTGGQVQRIVNHAEENDALAVVDILPGSEFQAYSSVVTADGRVTVQPGNVYIWPDGGLSWFWEPASSGEYELGLLITAFGGTTGFDSTRVTANNDGVDSTLRGETWLNFGFTLPKRAEWSRWAFFPSDRWMRSSSPDEADNITVYFVTDAGTELNDIAARFLEKYARTADSAITETTLADQLALELDFSYETEAGTYRGHAFAIFHPTRGIGMVFAAEALDGAGDLDATTALLRDNLLIIDLDALDAANEASWAIDGYEIESPTALETGTESGDPVVLSIQYPVRLDWMFDENGSTDILYRYVPQADPSGATRFVTMPPFAVGDQDVGAVLDEQIAAYVRPGADEFTVTDTRTYYGDNHTWEAALFTAIRDGAPAIGRVYTTVINGDAFIVWVETPDTGEAVTMFGDVFEPMVDGYTISGN
ncbi:MAG: pre-peptidase C-terminal domain-containing protein [Anaerolineae bacterium]|nr:pre-peptidase C-terminal domain-containing protein [Anaerolineae bacterium]